MLCPINVLSLSLASHLYGRSYLRTYSRTLHWVNGREVEIFLEVLTMSLNMRALDIYFSTVRPKCIFKDIARIFKDYSDGREVDKGLLTMSLNMREVYRPSE